MYEKSAKLSLENYVNLHVWSENDIGWPYIYNY